MIISNKKINTFKDFVVARGAEILIPTNEFEKIRFRSNGKVGIIYQGKRGHTLVGEACQAYRAFESNGSWTAGKINKSRLGVEKRSLLERDGNVCFYCLEPMAESEMTREHLLSRVHGGSNNINNVVLSHTKCNLEASHKSLIEKIKIRETNLKNKMGETFNECKS